MLQFIWHMTSLALYINELCDIITLYTACFMYTNIIRALFLTFLMISLRLQVSKSTFSIQKIRTNYGKFNVRYFGPKIWNDIEESYNAMSLFSFKRKLKAFYFNSY